MSGIDGCLMASILLQRQGQTPSSTGSLWPQHRAQVIVVLIAAHCTALTARVPLDLDLTDGTVHNLLRLRGEELLVYENLSSTDVGPTCNGCPLT